MNELYGELFQRWVRAFNEFGSLGEYRSLIKRKEYATTYRYEIKDYTPEIFPPGGELSAAVPMNTSYRAYGFDLAGRPVHVQAASSEGFYSYSENLVEYIEFSKATGAPGRMEIMRLKDGKKTALLRLYISRGENYLPGGGAQAFIQQVMIDSNDVICYIDQYIYKEDRITGADCFALVPGIGPYTYEQEYTYDNKGQLDEINNIYNDGRRQIAYARVPRDIDVAALSDGLSRAIADATVVALLKNKVEPLALLELSYQNVGNYLPSLEFKTAAEWNELITEHGDNVDFGLMFIPTYDHYDQPG